MQKLHRAPLALIVVMATALISLSSPVLHGQSASSAEADTPPLPGTFYSLQHPEWPPLPANLLDLPFYSVGNSVFVVDDRLVDYDALEKEAAEKAEAEGMTGGKGGAFGPMAAMYGSNELWIEITQVTNDFAHLTLHNTDTNLSQQLLSKIALTDPFWIPGEITNSMTNEIIFTPVPTAGQPIKFFRGAQGHPIVSILPFVTAIEPDTTNFDPGRNGVFVVSLSDTVSSNVTVVYRISGTAMNGVD